MWGGIVFELYDETFSLCFSIYNLDESEQMSTMASILNHTDHRRGGILYKGTYYT